MYKYNGNKGQNIQINYREQMKVHVISDCLKI